MTFEVNVTQLFFLLSETLSLVMPVAKPMGEVWDHNPFFSQKRIHKISAVQLARSHLPKREDSFQLLDKPVLIYLLHVRVN